MNFAQTLFPCASRKNLGALSTKLWATTRSDGLPSWFIMRIQDRKLPLTSLGLVRVSSTIIP